MKQQEPVSSTSSGMLSLEVLKELREHSRQYLKLDLVYLAAAFAVVTALRLSETALIERVDDFSFVGYGFLFLLAIDSTADFLVFRAWLSATRQSSLAVQPTRLMTRLASLQPFFHFAFLGGVVLIFLAFAEGHSQASAELRRRAFVQNQVELFMLKNRRIPSSLAEFRESSPIAQASLDSLGEGVRIEAVGDTGYRLLFAGDDGRLGTDDDFVVTPEMRLMNVVAGWDTTPKN